MILFIILVVGGAFFLIIVSLIIYFVYLAYQSNEPNNITIQEIKKQLEDLGNYESGSINYDTGINENNQNSIRLKLPISSLSNYDFILSTNNIQFNVFEYNAAEMFLKYNVYSTSNMPLSKCNVRENTKFRICLYGTPNKLNFVLTEVKIPYDNPNILKENYFLRYDYFEQGTFGCSAYGNVAQNNTIRLVSNLMLQATKSINVKYNNSNIKISYYIIKSNKTTECTSWRDDKFEQRIDAGSIFRLSFDTGPNFTGQNSMFNKDKLIITLL